VPVLLTALLALLVLAPPAAAAEPAPIVHAHRGGSILDGRPAFPEETMPAFRHAALVERVWLELDVKLTRDRVPVVLHDDTLERTTDCDDAIAAITAAELARRCRADRDGSPGSDGPEPRDAPAREPVPLPTLEETLAFAREAGAAVNVEIKNQPGDQDYDPSGATAERVMEVIAAARLDPARLIVQSFDPSNLDVAEEELPGVQTSYLTLSPSNEGGPPYAAARGYEWISPGGVPSAAYVQRARALGLRVVPYTLNTPADVRAAAASGVDALITDDPVMARKALGRPAPAAPAAGEPASPPAPAAPPATEEPPPGAGDRPPSSSGSSGSSAAGTGTDPQQGNALQLPPPAAVRVAPRTAATLLPRRGRTVLRRGGFAVRLVGRPARVRLEVTPRGRRTPVLARLTVSKRRDTPRRALVRLTAAGRRLLRERPGLRVVLRSR